MGLVPAWSKDSKIGSRLVNARSETITEKPSFRTAAAKRRCIIPADAYFELGYPAQWVLECSRWWEA